MAAGELPDGDDDEDLDMQFGQSSAVHSIQSISSSIGSVASRDAR